MSSVEMRNSVRKHGPLFLFVVMTIFGAAVIWFGKLYDYDIRIVTTVPVLLMIVYFLINQLPGVRVHNEQAGDNLYYMGFIFTLASLGISLYKFSGQSSIEDIVKNFGIAIVTTIGGISLRIFFNQMRRDPADIEKAVRHELAEMTRRVRTELDTSAMEFSSYRRTSNQMLSEGFEEISRQAERNGEAVRVAIEAMSIKATQTIQEAADRLFATLEQTTKQMTEFSEANGRTLAEMSGNMNASVAKVADRAEALASAIDGVKEKYASAKSPDELLRIEVSPAIDAIRTISETAAAAMAKNTLDTRETAKKVLAAITPFKQTSATLKTLVERLDTATAADQDSTRAVSELVAKIDDTLSVARSSSDVHTRSAQRIDALSESLNTAAANAASSRAQADRIELALSQFSRTEPSGEVSHISLASDDGEDRSGGAPNEPAPQTPEDRPKRGWFGR